MEKKIESYVRGEKEYGKDGKKKEEYDRSGGISEVDRERRMV